MSEVVDLRCPVGPRQLLGKVLRDSGHIPVDASNLMELACRDCARSLRRSDPDVRRVVHRYDLSGTLVESEIQRAGDSRESAPPADTSGEKSGNQLLYRSTSPSS